MRSIIILLFLLLLITPVSVIAGDNYPRKVNGVVNLEPSSMVYYIVCPTNVVVSSRDVRIKGYEEGDLVIYPVGVVDRKVTVEVKGECDLYVVHPAVIFKPPFQPHVEGVLYILPPETDIMETADVVVRLSNLGELECEGGNITVDGSVIKDLGVIKPGEYITEVVPIKPGEGTHSIRVTACDFSKEEELIVKKIYVMPEESIYFMVLNEWFVGQSQYARTLFKEYESNLSAINKQRIERLLSTQPPKNIQSHIAWSWSGNTINLVIDVFNLADTPTKVSVSVHDSAGVKPPDSVTVDVAPKSFSTVVLPFESKSRIIDLGSLELKSDLEVVKVSLPHLERLGNTPLHLYIPFVIAASSLVIGILVFGYGLIQRKRKADELREKLGIAGDLLGKGKYEEAVKVIAQPFVREVRLLLAEKPSTPIVELAKKCNIIDPNLAWALNYVNDVLYGKRRARYGDTQRLLEIASKFLREKGEEI